MSTFADPDTGGFIFFGVDDLVNTTLPLPPVPAATASDPLAPPPGA